VPEEAEPVVAGRVDDDGEEARLEEVAPRAYQEVAALFHRELAVLHLQLGLSRRAGKERQRMRELLVLGPAGDEPRHGVILERNDDQLVCKPREVRIAPLPERQGSRREGERED
jgi:hypothetical protein